MLLPAFLFHPYRWCASIKLFKSFNKGLHIRKSIIQCDHSKLHVLMCFHYFHTFYKTNMLQINMEINTHMFLKQSG